MDFIESLRAAWRGNRHVVLSGDGGSGKTTLLRFSMKQLLAQNSIPVYIDLSMLPATDSIRDTVLNNYCGASSAEQDIRQMSKILTDLMRQPLSDGEGPFVLLLDGLEETANPADRIQEILEFSSAQLRSLQIVVSARVMPKALAASFSEIRVLPLTDDALARHLQASGLDLHQLPTGLAEMIHKPLFLSMLLKAEIDVRALNSERWRRMNSPGEFMDLYVERFMEKSRVEDRDDLESFFKILLPYAAFNLNNNLFSERELLQNVKQGLAFIWEDGICRYDGGFLRPDDLGRFLRTACEKGLIHKATEKYKFSHDYVFEYMKARFVVNEMLLTGANPVPVLSERMLQYEILPWIGQIMGEHHFADKTDVWSDPSPIERWMNDPANGCCGEDDTAAFTTANCVEIMKASRNARITARYENLNLSRCDFTWCDLKNSRFSGKVSEQMFIPTQNIFSESLICGTNYKLSPDGRYVVATTLEHTFLYDSYNRESRQIKLPFGANIERCFFSSDSKHLCAISAFSLYEIALDTDHFGEVRKRASFDCPPKDCCYLQDSSVIVVAAGEHLYFWSENFDTTDIDIGTPICAVCYHSTTLYYATMNPKGFFSVWALPPQKWSMAMEQGVLVNAKRVAIVEDSQAIINMYSGGLSSLLVSDRHILFWIPGIFPDLYIVDITSGKSSYLASGNGNATAEFIANGNVLLSNVLIPNSKKRIIRTNLQPNHQDEIPLGRALLRYDPDSDAFTYIKQPFSVVAIAQGGNYYCGDLCEPYIFDQYGNKLSRYVSPMVRLRKTVISSDGSQLVCLFANSNSTDGRMGDGQLFVRSYSSNNESASTFVETNPAGVERYSLVEDSAGNIILSRNDSSFISVNEDTNDCTYLQCMQNSSTYNADIEIHPLANTRCIHRMLHFPAPSGPAVECSFMLLKTLKSYGQLSYEVFIQHLHRFLRENGLLQDDLRANRDPVDCKMLKFIPISTDLTSGVLYHEKMGFCVFYELQTLPVFLLVFPAVQNLNLSQLSVKVLVSKDRRFCGVKRFYVSDRTFVWGSLPTAEVCILSLVSPKACLLHKEVLHCSRAMWEKMVFSDSNSSFLIMNSLTESCKLYYPGKGTMYRADASASEAGIAADQTDDGEIVLFDYRSGEKLKRIRPIPVNIDICDFRGAIMDDELRELLAQNGGIV